MEPAKSVEIEKVEEGSFYWFKRYDQNFLLVFIYRKTSQKAVLNNDWLNMWLCYVGSDNKLKTQSISNVEMENIEVLSAEMEDEEEMRVLIDKLIKATQDVLIESFQLGGFFGTKATQFTTVEHYRILGLLLKFYGNLFSQSFIKLENLQLPGF